jgi:serine/threonine protein kinase
MIDTVVGLHQMHHGGRRALLHRDLKPRNMLVFSRSSGGSGDSGAGGDARTVASVCSGCGGCSAGDGVGSGGTSGATAGGGSGVGVCSGGSASGEGGAGGGVEERSCDALDPEVLVKVGDFGLSKPLDSTLVSRMLTEAGIGTPVTRPPEADNGVYTAQGDVYAWAAAMCMVVNQALGDPSANKVAGCDTPKKLRKTQVHIINSGYKVAKSAFPAVAAVLKQCVDKDRAERPCSTEARDRLMHAAGLCPSALGGTWVSWGLCCCGHCGLGDLQTAPTLFPSF